MPVRLAPRSHCSCAPTRSRSRTSSSSSSTGIANAASSPAQSGAGKKWAPTARPIWRSTPLLSVGVITKRPNVEGSFTWGPKKQARALPAFHGPRRSSPPNRGFQRSQAKRESSGAYNVQMHVSRSDGQVFLRESGTPVSSGPQLEFVHAGDLITAQERRKSSKARCCATLA
jgi:hypothetical protein